jgi:PKHD-type hydroxylase
MIRDDGERTMLFDLDIAIQKLSANQSVNSSAVQLTGIYHNLLRHWADV